ncbi:hypothetical protein DFH27DRAFT_326237 [Peziza echinospora]|nr:hypothetical protein DFH27DRAFT_326237 [Peziza echinospora]
MPKQWFFLTQQHRVFTLTVSKLVALAQSRVDTFQQSGLRKKVLCYIHFGALASAQNPLQKADPQTLMFKSKGSRALVRGIGICRSVFTSSIS